MTDRVGLCNLALTRVGNLPIQGEDAYGADEVLQIFDHVVDAVLTAKRWRFARRTISLARNTAAPTGGFWLYSFNLPGDRIGLPDAVYDNQKRERFTDYEFNEGLLVTNAEAIWVRYAWRPPFQNWPAEVIDCLVTAAMAEFAMALNDDAQLRQALRAEVWGDSRRPGQTGSLQTAATREAQSEPGTTMFGRDTRGPFIAARST